jgi:hypothetical protein
MRSKERSTAPTFEGKMLASIRRNTVVLESRRPLTAWGVTLQRDDFDGILGDRDPELHHPESLTSRPQRKSRAIQPVSNAQEDAAQTTGGR